MKTPADVKVLVVDDDKSLNEAISNLFKIFKFSVSSAFDGAQAWDLIRVEDYNVVVSDVRMPVMDGVQLLRNVRERNYKSPCVLIISGHNDYATEILYDAGANGFFAKPFNASAVREAVQNAVLRPLDRWGNSRNAAGSMLLKKRTESFTEMIEQGEVSFGRGGFFMHLTTPLPPVNTTVSFQLSFSSKGWEPSIQGHGIVRWSRIVGDDKYKRGVGIEITFLDEACRQYLVNWIEGQKFASYIPLK